MAEANPKAPETPWHKYLKKYDCWSRFIMSNSLTNSSNFDPQEGPEDTSFTWALRHYGEMGVSASYNNVLVFQTAPHTSANHGSACFYVMQV